MEQVSKRGSVGDDADGRSRDGRMPRRGGRGSWLRFRRGAVVSTFALLLCAARSAAAQSTTSSSGVSRSVTLITGDRVTLSGPGQKGVSIQRGPGREGVRVAASRIDVAGRSHLFVVPEDAAPLIASGKVDRRLFDVSLLLEYGYDDDRRAELPLIVTYEKGATFATAAARGVPGAAVARALPAVNGLSVSSPKERAREVWGAVVSGGSGGSAQAVPTEPIGKLWLDGLLQPVLDQSTAQIGAPAAWDLGYEGDGVRVAVLDTGVDDAHPDLIDSVIVQRNFTTDPDGDQVGHGTHVASIVAGSGAASDGQYRGVAPGAQLLAGKVCEGFGCPESSIIAGMQWAVAEEGARVVNMSLGGGDTPGYDPLEEAVSTLTAQYGALFVIAAGNTGPGSATIESPSAIASALAVGAVDREDQVAPFSSRGFTVDGALKPDLTAPGVDIVAARGAGTELGELVGEDYVTASGTSMATPHVAGAAALLLQQNPSWGVADLKSALIGTAAFTPGATNADQGGGRVDVAAALEASLLASAPSLGFGIARWPHEDDEPVTRTLTYLNRGGATELELSLDVYGPDGTPAPVGMFRVEPSTLAIAAGGSASVRVIADTRPGALDGVFGGRLIAADASGRRLAVPVAVQRESESYDLTLRHLDRDGQPTANYSGILLGLDTFFFTFFFGEDADDSTYRLPRGRYVVESDIDATLEGVTPALLLAPNVQLTADTLLELDARQGVPTSLTLDHASAIPVAGVLSYDVTAPNAGLSSTIVFSDVAPIYNAAVVGEADPTLLASLQGIWEDTSTTPPSVYNAAWGSVGGLPVGDYPVDVHQLGVVHAHYAASLGGPVLNSDVAIAPFRLDSSTGWGTSTLDLELPHDRTEYYYTGDPSLGWVGSMFLYDDDFSQVIFIDGPPSEYLPGQQYEARWNAPIFAAALPDRSTFFDFAIRQGDFIQVSPRYYADSDQHECQVLDGGRARVYRDGELIIESDIPFVGSEVPPEPAAYRVELETSQSTFELTTQQRVVYSFESGHTPEEEKSRLPLLSVRFDAALDGSGRAPRGSYELPFSVARHDRGLVTDVNTPTLEVSYDDGATWAGAPVRCEGERFTALLDHPSTGAYVSLRAAVQDTSGNAVEQTIIRAYGLTIAP